MTRAGVLLERALAATVLRRLTLFTLDLSTRPAARVAAVPLEFGFLDAGDREALDVLRPGLGAVADDRFAHGERCFAARARDGRVASVRWVARGTARIEFLACTLELERHEAYNFDTWTDPATRGLGIAAATGSHLNEALASEGVGVVLRAVWPANDDGLRSAAREGFAPAGTVASLGLGSWRRRIVRRRSPSG